MNEDFLIYLWQFQLFTKELVTSEGIPIKVIRPGTRNTNSGPDFFNAMIKMGKTIWAGNIEVHINSSDWNRHNHQNDPAFDNIILHVVFREDETIYRQNREKIPTLELKEKYNPWMLEKYKMFMESQRWIPCEEVINTVNYFDLTSFFDTLMTERLEQKAEQIRNELKQLKLDFREVFYRKLARNFGFNINSEAFELLARSLPLNILSKHINNVDQIEALLFGQAGLLNKTFKEDQPNQLKSEYQFLAKKYGLKPLDAKLWKFMRLRPANFPTLRIAQFAQMLYRSSAELTNILEIKNINEVANFFKVGTSNYWNNHYRFDVKIEIKKKMMGDSSIQLILINTVVPFLFIYGQHKADEKMQMKALTWLEKIKAENNHIVSKFRTLEIVPQNAMQSQALLQLKSNFCDNRRCLECRIGHILLKATVST